MPGKGCHTCSYSVSRTLLTCLYTLIGMPSVHVILLQLLMKSDVLNCQHSMIDLMTNSYAQKAALWCLYGKTEMSSLSSQLLLHLNTSNPTQGVQSYNGEGTCQAICNIANILTEEVCCMYGLCVDGLLLQIVGNALLCDIKTSSQDRG